MKNARKIKKGNAELSEGSLQTPNRVLIGDEMTKKISQKDALEVDNIKENDSEDKSAMDAVATILSYIGEDPSRQGLQETPARVIKAFSEYFSGYEQDAFDVLNKTFEEVEGFCGPICVENINFISHCEHHMAPFVGNVSITYIPNGKVVGLSKLARVVDIYAKRLQVQERMTAQIASAIYDSLNPKAVKVVVRASHFCLNHRGANKPSSTMMTVQTLGDEQCFT